MPDRTIKAVFIVGLLFGAHFHVAATSARAQDEQPAVPFLRYAHAHRGVNGIRQNLSVGVGLEEVLGQNDDLIGVGFSWAEPSDRTLRDQYVFEAFYRFYLTPYTHLSPDLQVVIDPAEAPDRNSVTVFGLRLRTLY